MKTSALLLVWVAWLTPTVFAGSFSRTAREAQELEAKGIPVAQQAMEMAAELIRSLAVDLSDASGKHLGRGLLASAAVLRRFRRSALGLH